MSELSWILRTFFVSGVLSLVVASERRTRIARLSNTILRVRRRSSQSVRVRERKVSVVRERSDHLVRTRLARFSRVVGLFLNEPNLQQLVAGDT